LIGVARIVMEGRMFGLLRFIVLGVTVLAGCASMDPAQREESAQGHYDIGVGALATNELPRAVAELEAAVREAPQNARYHYALGNAYLMNLQPDPAVRTLVRAVELDPRYSDAYNALGGAYVQQKKWELAIDAFRKALANPRYMKADQAHVNLGNVYHVLGRYPLAAEQFRKVIDILPQSPDGYFLLGRTLLAQGNAAEAKEPLTKAVTLLDSIPLFHLELGRAHMRLNDKKAASAEFRRVVELSPAGPEANDARRHLAEMK
jgi:Tfp pilus assembly protein PilF